MVKEKEVRKVRLFLYFGSKDSVALCYTGRLLAWLNDKQFAALIKHKDLREKMLTSESVDVSSLYEEAIEPGMSGKRLVLAINTKEDELVQKTLFISERIDDFTFSNPESMTFETGNQQGWLNIESIDNKG